MRYVRNVAILAFATAGALACRGAEYSAQYEVPGSPIAIGVRLRQINAPLAEFDRFLFLASENGPRQEVEMFPDTGGYSLLNLYSVGGTLYRVYGVGNAGFDVDTPNRRIAKLGDVQPPGSIVPQRVYVGAFDFDHSGRWRFIGAGEREERDPSDLHRND
jgi:hypothetical protein